MHVVLDRDGLTVLHIAPGMKYRMPERLARLPRGEHGTVNWDIRASGNWKLVERAWKSTHALTFLYPDKYYAIRMFWAESDWRFLGWYVNFQRPYQRTTTGFDALDLALDIVVSPNDLAQQQLKDVDQYKAGIACGAITSEDVEGIELAKTELRDLGRLSVEPFVSEWRSWRPTE